MNGLLTAKDVAERLRVGVSTVYAWAEQGHIPSIVLSEGTRRRCIRFREQALEQWVRDREQPRRVDRRGKR